ncbi:hypothetical protein SAMN05216188_10373 [Lentzea xinjiangensis]|uniref:Uncharacterized protein n=1 Tax=Lentzea xinjiangensis TaxID=402600 RepID=A0A1H9G4D7_9PSEU|nr:hypothetical protein [Lentzea xinjiangensis]SEQ44931.1 hypothetical protein SAMN05216188_10373 [Lentzea xinjiangensis]
MLALAAAVAFGLALLFDLANVSLGDVVTGSTLVTLGLLLTALHLAGVGTGNRSWSRRRARR